MLFIFIAAAALAYNLVTPLTVSATAIKFNVAPGESTRQIADALEASGLIRSTLVFRWWASLTGRENKFKSGEYYINPSSNIIVIGKILTGELAGAAEITLRFIEGWTLRDINEYLVEQGISTTKEFADLTQTKSGVESLLAGRDYKIFSNALSTGSLEGYLFPDTYRFRKGVSLNNVLTKMLDNFTSKINLVYAANEISRAANIHEIITLSSIVEREVAQTADRAVVADIFWRRLKKGMPLQADSTINYITGKKTPAVSLDDLLINSPYNSYRHAGLPPGPISNPSLASIKAVLLPQQNEYWFFLTTADGMVIYSKDFNAHVAAKNKYLK